MGFEVSEEFKQYAAQSQHAFQEAAQAEHGSSLGCSLPVGTRGKAVITGGKAGQSKPSVENGLPRTGKPYYIIEFEYQEPEAAKGRKESRYFDISHHEKFSTAQKLMQFYDWMEDAGLPREVRGTADINQVFSWAAAEPRVFTFMVVAGYQGRPEIKPVPDVPQGGIPMPTSTNSLLGAGPSTAQSAPAYNVPTQAPPYPQPAPAPTPVQQAPTTQSQPAQPEPAPASAPVQQPAPAQQSAPAPGLPNPGSTVTAFGQQFEVVSYENNSCTLRNPVSGQTLPNVPLSAVQA